MPETDYLKCNWVTKRKFNLRIVYDKQCNFDETIKTDSWNWIWKFKGPRWTSLCLWFRRHSKLPTKPLYFERKINHDNFCPICDKGEEILLYALQGCQWTKDTWDVFVSHSRKQVFYFFTKYSTWIEVALNEKWKLHIQHKEWGYMFREIVHTIWNSRNRILLDSANSKWGTNCFIKSVKMRLEDISKVHAL